MRWDFMDFMKTALTIKGRQAGAGNVTVYIGLQEKFEHIHS